MKFEELIKNKEILKVLQEMKYEEATKIQEEIIPYILEGKDVLGQSQTGTGKTLAFALPIVEKINNNNDLQVIVLTPTRELAVQVKREIENLIKYTNIKITCVYGSSSIEEQIKTIKNGVEIVVGTPGRVKDLIKRKVLNLSNIKYFVLDEADEMLSMGFEDDIEYIFNKTNNTKQVMLFSATMPKPILKIAETYMANDYKLVTIMSEEVTSSNVEQEYYVVNSKTRFESLCRLIDFYSPKRSIIFCRTKKNADELFDKLVSRGYSTDKIHGDITQGQRIATLDKFKAGVFKILIATDVAARGIHVNNIDIVFNYNLPESRESYVHRIGRTGRVDEKGISITLVTTSEEKIVKDLEFYIKSKIIKKELPNEESIMKNRVYDVFSMIDIYKNEITSDLFNDYVSNLTNLEKDNIIKVLLEQKLKDSIGSDFNVDVLCNDKAKKHNKRELKDFTRIFLTIGKLDGIEKRDFLLFLEKKANVKEGTFTGMEIMTKFTFMNVNNKYLDQVLKTCNNITYNNRLIRIEKAKN